MIMHLDIVLQKIGLSPGETKVYLALLKLGSVNVAKIKEATQLHRTTIYDFLESLVNKGLVNYVTKDGIKFFEAAPPGHLQDYLEEKEALLKQALPELAKLQEFEQSPLNVGVYRGKKGFTTFVSTLLKPDIKEFIGFGIDEAKFMEKFPAVMTNYFKKEKRLGITEKIIAEVGTKLIHDVPHIKYKFIQKEFFPPTPTGVYGDKVFFMIWDPLNLIVMENKDLAESYRRWFNLLWKIART